MARIKSNIASSISGSIAGTQFRSSSDGVISMRARPTAFQSNPIERGLWQRCVSSAVAYWHSQTDTYRSRWSKSAILNNKRTGYSWFIDCASLTFLLNYLYIYNIAPLASDPVKNVLELRMPIEVLLQPPGTKRISITVCNPSDTRYDGIVDYCGPFKPSHKPNSGRFSKFGVQTYSPLPHGFKTLTWNFNVSGTYYLFRFRTRNRKYGGTRLPTRYIVACVS